MSECDNKVLEVINHYQDALNRYVSRGEEPKILHCLDKLRRLPITVSHLEETGVGRSVNSLRKVEGDVGDGARRLVNQWKEMVEQHAQHDSDNEDAEDVKQECAEIEENSSLNDPNTSNLHYKHDKKSSSKKEHGKDRERNESSGKRHEKSSSSSHKIGNKSKRKHEESSSRAAEDDSDNSEELDDRKKRKRDERTKENSSKTKKHRDSNQTSSTDKEKYSEKTERSKEKDRKDKNKGDHREKDAVESQKLKENEHSRKRESFKDKEKADVGKESKERKNESINPKKQDKHKSSKISNDSSSSSKIIKEKLKNVDSIDSGSGASFAEVLGMLEPLPIIKSAKKKSNATNRNDAKSNVDASSSNKQKLSPEKYVAKEDSPMDMLDDTERDLELDDVPNLLSIPPKFDPLEINISSLLPTLTPNYRPIANNPLLNENPRHKALSEYENLSNVITSKNARTKVYSGNKMAFGKIPSLFEMCIRILMDNIDALEYTGGVPYMILKPVLDKCTPDQLLMLEHFNPYLIEDTDGLWNFHCQREFRNKKREEWESWREMYNRCVDEREAKLRALTANIKQSQDKCLPVRQTKLAYVDSVAKPPRSVARKQQKNGYIPDVKSPLVTPSSRLSAIAQSGSAGLVSVPNPGPRAALGASSNAVMKIKKAPLMQKTLQLMKGRFRR